MLLGLRLPLSAELQSQAANVLLTDCINLNSFHRSLSYPAHMLRTNRLVSVAPLTLPPSYRALPMH